MTRAVIRASDLQRHFGSVRAVDGIDFEVAEGQILGLIGPNGAGKTTLLRALLGLTRYRGELEVLGLEPLRQRDRLMQEVCFIADTAILPRWMRVAIHPPVFGRPPPPEGDGAPMPWPTSSGCRSG